jgi:hypothetical protein
MDAIALLKADHATMRTLPGHRETTTQCGVETCTEQGCYQRDA